MLIPVTVRAKAYVCACSSAGIAGSNPAADLYIRLLCLLCAVFSALCDMLFIRSEESYGVRVCVCVCVPNFL